jgi:pyruvate-formate lyase-activating enzyme
MLNSSDTREQIYRYVEQLSQERLAVVLDFLSYLVERENNDATAELLAIPGFVVDLAAAEQEADVDELTDWRVLRSDV